MLSRVAAVLALALIGAAPAICQPAAADPPGNARAREFWNEKFRSGLPNVRKEPSRLLIEGVQASAKPGSALDLGCGDGRNLLYLAAHGWKATGVDISEVAIEQAKAAAAQQRVNAEFVVSDLDAFDLGKDRWDLLSSIYMQDWHLKSPTDTFWRMKEAVRPGGLVIIEGFGPPNGLDLNRVKLAFTGFTIVRADVVADDPDWGQGRGNKQILRFVARKPQTHVGVRSADNSELAQIYDADQGDRGGPVDWKLVGPRDAARRKRVRELLDEGAIATGKDYERAAMVFQHGDTPDDILLAHVLAVTSLGKGNAGARWLAAASLDRYLHRLGQPQVFGTQFTNKDVSSRAGWTMEPYNRQLLPPSLLEANCVPDRDHQTEMLNAIRRGEEPPAPRRKPCEAQSQE